ncbi:hypothetical protein [Paenibacillus lautus]
MGTLEEEIIHQDEFFSETFAMVVDRNNDAPDIVLMENDIEETLYGEVKP